MANVILSTRKRLMYEKDAEIIKFLRRNPIYALEFLYGIRLMDSQKYAFQMAWNATYVNLTCSRKVFAPTYGNVCRKLL